MLIGQADADARCAGAPTMATLDTEAVTLTGVELMQVLCEIPAGIAQQLLPPALHPTNPGVVSWLIYSCPESPWGAFRLAQTRLQCRSGTRPRGFLISGVIDNEEAGAALSERWGYSLVPGEIEWRRGYDGTEATVFVDDTPVLALTVRDLQLLPPDVVQFVASIHPASTPRGYRLLQVDPSHAVARAERGQPIIDHFDSEAWGEESITPSYPITGSVCVADVTLPKLRFLCRPGELAFSGTEII